MEAGRLITGATMGVSFATSPGLVNKIMAKSKQQSAAKPKGVQERRVAMPAAIAYVNQRRSIALATYNEVERVSSLAGSPTFLVQGSYAINPALPSLFPWLANHATLYDKYRFRKLVFRFKTSRGSSSSGTIMMSFDSDTLDPTATSSMEMSQSAVYSDGPVWNTLALSVPCDQDWRFTRSASVANSDNKTYDLGRLTVAVEGCADTLAHGFIEVEYSLEVKHKQSLAAGGLSTNRQVYEAFNTAVTIGTNPTPLVFNAATNPVGAVAQPTGGWLLKAGSYALDIANTLGTAIGWDVVIDGVASALQIPPFVGNSFKKVFTLDKPAVVVPRAFNSTGTATLPANGAQLLLEYL